MTLAVLWPALAAFLAALAISAGLTPLVRRLAVRTGAVVEAREDRWHDRATPTLGGVAIFAAFLLTTGGGVLWLLGPERVLAVGVLSVETWSPIQAAMVAGILMFAAGLWDDLLPMAPVAKLTLQIGVAVILVTGGFLLPLSGFYPLDVLFSMAWFVGITNAVNLMDNMDGLAAGVVLVAALVLGGLLLMDGLALRSLVAFALAGATAGFLIYNYPPARIFMGDSGALFLGVMLAALALSPAPGGGRGVFAVIAVPALLLAVPILDTSLVTASRVLEGRSVIRGGRDHTSHRLVALGLPERHAVHVLWGLAAAAGLVALALHATDRRVAGLVGGLLLVGFFLLGSRLLRVGLPGALLHPEGREEEFRRAILWARVRPVVLVVGDVLAVIVAYYGAYVLRWSPADFADELAYFRLSLPLVVGAKILGFWLAGLYEPALAREGPVRLLRASAVGSLTAVAILVLVAGFGFSRGVLVLDFALCTMLVGLIRLVPGLAEGEMRVGAVEEEAETA